MENKQKLQRGVSDLELEIRRLKDEYNSKVKELHNLVTLEKMSIKPKNLENTYYKAISDKYTYYLNIKKVHEIDAINGFVYLSVVYIYEDHNIGSKIDIVYKDYIQLEPIIKVWNKISESEFMEVLHKTIEEIKTK